MIGSTPSSQASGTLDTIAVASTNSSSSLSRAIPSIPFRGLVPMRVTEASSHHLEKVQALLLLLRGLPPPVPLLSFVKLLVLERGIIAE